MMIRVPEIISEAPGSLLPELACPICGEHGLLSHGLITVYWRQEDVSDGASAAISEGAVTFTISEKANPVFWRGGLSIEFGCGNCGHAFPLCLAQSNGRTNIFWRVGGEHASA